MRFLAAALLLASVATPALGQALPPPAPLPGDGAEDTKLKRLFYDSDERDLALNPISAIFRGDLRYADRFGDYISDPATARDKRNLESDLAALKAIDRSKLTHVDQLAYDVFRNQAEINLRGYAPAIQAVDRLLPMDHFSGFQTFYPDFAGGKGAAPFKTVTDYENNLKRNAGYAALYDRAIARFREGMAKGVVQPRLVVENMIAQFDALIAQGVEGSVFYAPVTMFPASISAAERQRLTAAYAAQVRNVITPAHVRMRDFLKTDYLPKARATVGLSALPGGAALYAYRIEQNTTLPLPAEQVHQLGLSEVARITREMEAQKTAAGFKGTLPAFFEYLRTEKRFQPTSAEAVREGFEAIGKRIDARVREQFGVIPKTPLEIRPVPDYRAKSDAAGSYQGGTPDGTRPGIFYYNTYDLPVRYTWGMETLFLHEAVPGHHFQISLAQENAALPAFMRFGGNTAYVEGWALYAETLWKPLGMETDPYQRMGGLNDEMLRAMRLVVDTGIHAKGWSREQAIDYMLTHSAMAKTDATAEVERYIAIPGQALAYKIGQLTILKLKAEAQAKQGASFDPRAFHAAVLDSGALPMPVLEDKVRREMGTK
ncbi:DUF885 domain-containing protein [Arthrobacter sp. TPD3018]|uniref:DUF885 domain-containing protein n=1 Tax=Bacteria TaxID=2 RepID=UPI000D524831|nr:MULTISPECIES: DUF885 domain-containing protein [Bacteria]PVE59061.1 DUF885 domain-containing protein [Sphingomonas sp. TPD3009]PVE60584.1 DUF885 domain-containing protein [Arthrobacter sp. TPD3018]PVE87260.1 DUF885 domain-containing protein [Sphingomonas melonis]